MSLEKDVLEAPSSLRDQDWEEKIRIAREITRETRARRSETPGVVHRSTLPHYASS